MTQDNQVVPSETSFAASATARADILSRLHVATNAQLPFDRAVISPLAMRPVIQVEGDRRALMDRFIAEVERVRGVVHRTADDETARCIVLDLLAQKQARQVTVWADLPLTIEADLAAAGIATVSGDMHQVARADAGITGAACAIAATGTLVLEMGAGRARSASLLVPIHIVLLRADQLLPRLEDYLAQKRAENLAVFERTSNVVLLTGSSRTSDIEMSVVYGVHGPLELHIVLIEG